MQHLAEMLSLGCGPIVQCKQQLVEVFFEKYVFKNFANFRGKRPSWSLFLLKRDSKAGVYLWNLQNFQEHLC